MAEDNAVVAGLQPAVGRLSNALVAVLGPELTLGSPAYCRCRAIIREMQVGRPFDPAPIVCSSGKNGGKSSPILRTPA